MFEYFWSIQAWPKLLFINRPSVDLGGWIAHYSVIRDSNNLANAPELLENIEEMFPCYWECGNTMIFEISHTKVGRVFLVISIVPQDDIFNTYLHTSCRSAGIDLSLSLV